MRSKLLIPPSEITEIPNPVQPTLTLELSSFKGTHDARLVLTHKAAVRELIDAA